MKMRFSQRAINMDKAVVMFVLLSTLGQCAVLTESLQTTTSPDPTTSSTNTYTYNSSMAQPLVQRSHRTECGDEHPDYCANGGVCMFPQDSTKPSCNCAASFSGPRCMILSDFSQTRVETEKVLGITFGVTMILFALIVAMYCCIQRRCVKSPPLIKSAPATSV